jgi:hypothetical protein
MAASGLYSVPQPRSASIKTNKCKPEVNNKVWGEPIVPLITGNELAERADAVIAT